jgi:acetate kinase
MKVVAFNCGSSTLKFKVIALGEDTLPGQEIRIAGGSVGREAFAFGMLIQPSDA